jgi:hypothetical protein
VGELQTTSNAVGLDDAASVRVEIEMGAGELHVAGGATELLEANFTYNVADLKPEVNYSGGTLAVRTPEVRAGIASLADLDEYRNEWDLRLNDDVPMEMRVSPGASRTDLKLGSLSLTKLDIDGGAGPLTVDLTGDWQNDLKATIAGGLGKRTLILPRDTGVRVVMAVGVGPVDAPDLTKEGEYYTNDAYGQSSVTLEIEVAGGVGETELRVAQ